MALQDSLDQLRSIDVSDLDLNNIGSWPSALKGLVMIIVLVLIMVVGYSLYLSDKRAELTKVEAQEKTLRRRVQHQGRTGGEPRSLPEAESTDAGDVRCFVAAVAQRHGGSGSSRRHHAYGDRQ